MIGYERGSSIVKVYIMAETSSMVDKMEKTIIFLALKLEFSRDQAWSLPMHFFIIV